MSADPPIRSAMQLSLRCEIRCDLASVREASLRVREFLQSEGLAEEELAGWELALVEAGNNAVEHVREDRRHAGIEIFVTCSPTQVELRITDHTPGFDWGGAGDLPDDESEGGRGVFLIKALVDQSAYFRGPDGNVLVLSKARVTGAAPAADLPARLAEQEAMLAGMTEELSSAYEALVAIFRHSTDLGRTPDLKAFAVRLLEDLKRLTEADAVLLRLVGGDGDALQSYLVLPGCEDALPDVSVGGTDGGAEHEAWQTRQDVWFGTTRPLTGTDPLRKLSALDVGIVHPFLFGDQVLGTLTLARKAGAPTFGTAYLNLLHTFSEFFAIQYGNLRFVAERIQAQVVRHDLEIAAELQRSLLPQRMPLLPPFEIAGEAESAREVGGDFYDVIPAGDHGVLFVIADVMGKGLPAALFASVLRSVVRAMNRFVAGPGELLTRVNELLYQDLSRVDMFATAQLVFLAHRTRTLTVATAGHCPLLFAAPGGGRALATTEGGLPLGVEPSHLYKDFTIKLAPGSRILLYTDGIFELQNPAGEIFGEERLATWLGHAVVAENSATALSWDLAKTLTSYAQGAPAKDDQTFILISETDPAQ